MQYSPLVEFSPLSEGTLGFMSLASFTSALLVAASAGLGLYLIRWGVRGTLKVLNEIKEAKG